MSIAYWLKSDCVEVNAAINDHEEIMTRLVDLMNAGGNIDDNDNFTEIFFGEEYRTYIDTFKDETFGATSLRFVKGVVIVAVCCGGVKSPGISAVTVPDGIYFPSNDIANNPARLFVTIAYPMDGSWGHIKLACELEKMLDDATFKDALINAKSAEEFLSFVTAKENGTFSADASRENLP